MFIQSTFTLLDFIVASSGQTFLYVPLNHELLLQYECMTVLTQEISVIAGQLFTMLAIDLITQTELFPH